MFSPGAKVKKMLEKIIKYEKILFFKVHISAVLSLYL